MNDERLRLRARDAEDVQVLSAILQDAIVPIGDMGFDAPQRRFLLAVSRFCWERAAAAETSGEKVFERINCAITVEGVTGAQFTGFDPQAKGIMLDLLALVLEDGRLQLVFAGGARVRLALADWSVRVEDFGASWPTDMLPRHETAL